VLMDISRYFIKFHYLVYLIPLDMELAALINQYLLI
jgi:hypothetical protein